MSQVAPEPGSRRGCPPSNPTPTQQGLRAIRCVLRSLLFDASWARRYTANAAHPFRACCALPYKPICVLRCLGVARRVGPPIPKETQHTAVRLARGGSRRAATQQTQHTPLQGLVPGLSRATSAVLRCRGAARRVGPRPRSKRSTHHLTFINSPDRPATQPKAAPDHIPCAKSHIQRFSRLHHTKPHGNLHNYQKAPYQPACMQDFRNKFTIY